MKFNDEEFKRFREDFQEEVKFLEKKYSITITLGNITGDDSFFSARIMCEHASNNKEDRDEVPSQDEVQKLNPNMRILAREVLEDSSKPVKKQKPKEEPKKPIVKEEVAKPKEEPKVIKPRKPEIFNKKKETKKKLDLDNLDVDDITLDDLDNLDLDNLDLDDTKEEVKKTVVKQEVKEEPKKPIVKEEVAKPKEEPKKPIAKEPVKKPAKPKLNINELNIEDMTDDEIDELYEKYELVDEPITPTKSVSKYDESQADDIEEISDDEFEDVHFRDENYDDVKDDSEDLDEDDSDLEKYLEDDDLSEFFDEKDEEPTNIFEEKSRTPKTNAKTTNYDDLDELLSSGGRYSFSFKAKLIQGEGLVQDFYTDLKNELLGYRGIRSRISWDDETFAYEGESLAKINIVDNNVELYLALNCEEYLDSRFIFKDVSKNPKYANTPLKVVIKRYNDMQSALELIAEMMEQLGIENEGPLYDDYHYDFETKEELIDKGLIKKI